MRHPTPVLVCAILLLASMQLESIATAQDVGVQNEQEHNNGPGHTAGATANEINTAVEFAGKFRQPAVLAFNDDQLRSWASSAKKAKSELSAESGDLKTTYDVVIQVGHYPRVEGATGGQGTFISEQEAGAWVAEMLAAKLKGEGLKTVIVPADTFKTGLRTRAFIALHTDASVVKCNVGPSLGYGDARNKAGMNTLAVAVAISLGVSPKKFMQDNYTKNLSGYYAYARVSARDYEGVLEMFELTCIEQEKKFLGSASTLADNLATAIQLSLR